MDCKTFQRQLPDLIVDPAAVSSPDVQQHLATCAPCEEEYTSLVNTLSVMDSWTAPDPSPYFDQKLAVLLREEVAQPKLGFFGRVREHLLFNTGRQFRPAVAGALALVLMVGGGSYAGLQSANHRDETGQVSATVNDLQTLDKNEQTIKQIDQLLQDEDSGDDANANAPS